MSQRNNAMLPLGEIIEQLSPKIAAIRETLEARREEFLAQGGRCVSCWDTGVVAAVVAADGGLRICEAADCSYGLRRRQDRAARQAAILIQQSGSARYDCHPETHPNLPLVEHIQDWTDRTWLAALRRIDRPAVGGDDPFLLLYGATGTGKSQLAAAMLRRVIRRGAGSARFVSVVKMLDNLRPHGPQTRSLLDDATAAQAVVLDDLGRDPLTDWVERVLYQVVDERYTRRSWTILTTNKDPYDMESGKGLIAWVGDATYYRIMERSAVVNCGGEDRNLRVG